MAVLPIAALTFALSLIVTLLVTPIVIRLAWGVLALDRPDTRKFHPAPVPRLGGVAVLAGFAAGVGLSLWWTGYSGSLFGAVQYHWLGWIGAIAGLFLCGLWDDLRGLGAGTKLLVQCAAGVAVYAAGFRIEFVRLAGDASMDLRFLALPLTLLWVVGVTNAVNLIDGLDGLATGLSLLITCTIVAISYTTGVFPVMIISLALAGSLLGFLPYNFNPARIFLGDSGSQFIGFTLAVVSIRGLQKSATAVAILAPILVLGLPILDTILVVLRRGWRVHAAATEADLRGLRVRIKGSRRIFEADREHIHHNLIDLGLSHRKSVLLLYAGAAIFCAAAFALVALRNPPLALILSGAIALATAFVKIWSVLSRDPAGSIARPRTPPPEGPALPDDPDASEVGLEARAARQARGGGGC